MKTTNLIASLSAAASIIFAVPTSAQACVGDSNGEIEGLEQCDDGANNSDTVPDACRTDCTLPKCGDGVVDSGEECDDGAGNSDVLPDACRMTCLEPSCGDGIIDVVSGELCDLGPNNGLPGADCNSQCYIPYCGNGILDGAEQCDHGSYNSNLIPDACRLDCFLPICGDAVQDSGEQCDEGLDNSDFRPDGCRSDCQWPTCGDGIADPSFNEACDLGAGNADDGSSECRTDCTFYGCGNGLREGDEVCDDGNTDDTDACTSQCRPAVCGDIGVYGGIEACDDAIACDYACRVVAETCGDGSPTAGEECDEGAQNSEAPDAVCRTDCRLARCGDGIIDSGEACDRGADCAPDCVMLRAR